jgi:translation elongation factor EF-Ts
MVMGRIKKFYEENCLLEQAFIKDDSKKIAELLSELKHPTRVRVLPYHSYAASKYEALEMENTLPETLPTDEEIACAKALFGDLIK